MLIYHDSYQLINFLPMGETAFSSMYGCTADVGLSASAQPKPLEAQQPPFCPLSQEARWSSDQIAIYVCLQPNTILYFSQRYCC